MSFAAAQSIADAVLYEGYLLYPYRASSVKNRRRWTFGGVYPEAHCAAQQGSDASFMQTECLVCGSLDASIDLRVRFLHLVATTDDAPSPGAESWQEAEPRDVVARDLRLGDLVREHRPIAFEFPALDEKTLGRTRRREALRGVVHVSATPAGGESLKLTVRIENLTDLAGDLVAVRDEALLRTLVSTHTLLEIAGAEFVSMIDPPEKLRDAAAACKSVGTWPVLVGEAGHRNGVLSSPVILYDYPRVAPESPGDLFDGTEIDEILTLRILTLTDEEKRDVRALDGRARALLERTESLGSADLARLHGVMRREGSPETPGAASPWGDLEQPKPARFAVRGVDLGAGDRVRLMPRGRADVMDLVLAGKLATIATIEQDYEGRVLFAVTIDDDPGRDLGLLGQPGHRFFFGPEEVEPAPTVVVHSTPVDPNAREEGPPKILVAGVGNIFLGDDAFGSELARRLMVRSWPEGVRVVDFGIRGIDLTYALLDGYDAAIVIDVVRRGGAPGTLYVIEPEIEDEPSEDHVAADMHGLHPARVLSLVRGMGGRLGTVRLVGCEPAIFGDACEMATGMSEPVEAALDAAAEMVTSLVMDLRSERAHA